MIFNIFIILFIVKGILTQNCQLDASSIYKKWIHITKPTPYTWDVLHTDYLQDRTSLYLMCKTSSKILEIKCNRGTLLKPTIPSCNSTYKSTTALQPNEVSCQNMGGNFYQEQYILPDRTSIKLYEVCYNNAKERVLYTRHNSSGFNLSFKKKYIGPQFSPGDEVCKDCVDSLKPKNVFETFVRLLGKRQTYIATNLTQIIDRGHLVNVQDFLTYDQKDATYKYVNVMPQFQGSNYSNWKKIENWIRRLVTQGTHAVIVSGTFGVLSLRQADSPHADVPMYLMPNNKNPIPLWAYKIVQYAGQCYAFVTLNNQFNINPTIIPSECEEKVCPEGLEFNKDPKNGVSHCCDYNHFKNNFGDHVSLC